MQKSIKSSVVIGLCLISFTLFAYPNKQLFSQDDPCGVLTGTWKGNYGFSNRSYGVICSWQATATPEYQNGHVLLTINFTNGSSPTGAKCENGSSKWLGTCSGGNIEFDRDTYKITGTIFGGTEMVADGGDGNVDESIDLTKQ